MTAEEVCNPHSISREESIRVAKRRADERRSFEIEVFRFLTQHLMLGRVDVDVVERAIEVLIAIAPLPRLHGALRSALGHNDPKVRSKAAGAVGRCVADVPLLQRLLTDNDPRVRANTLEALWHLRTPEIEAVFTRALSDMHHRAVANATYGLYLIDPVKYFPKVVSLTEHPHAGYRAAAAWLLGRMGDATHISLLRPLLTEKNTDVRSAAFRALAVLRSIERTEATPVAGAA